MDPRRMRAKGLMHVPEDRHHHGLVMNFDAYESAILGFHRDAIYGHGLLDRSAMRSALAQDMEAYDIRPRNPQLRTRNFSGGNQQKIVLSREIEREAKVLLIGQPTRGVDVGAIEFIHNRLLHLREEGKAILLVSVELDEIIALSDRILVMCDGRLTGERTGVQTDIQDLGLLMGGVNERVA
jgi:simple sugar transport system ATP-binding protein